MNIVNNSVYKYIGDPVLRIDGYRERKAMRIAFPSRRSILVALPLIFVGAYPGVAARRRFRDMKRLIIASYVDDAGQRVAIEAIVRGSGPSVVLIPSLGRGAADFDDLSVRLAQAGFTAVAVNPRGVGGSTGPSARTLADYARDVIEAVRHVARNKGATLIGHAFGNRVARATATQFPDEVSRLILLAAGGQAPIPPAAMTALQSVFDLRLSPQDHIAAVQAAFFAPGNSAQVWRDGWYPVVAAAQQTALRASPPDTWTSAGSVPILIVQAVQDVVAPPVNAEALQRPFPDRVRVEMLDQAGHAMLPEQPDKIASIVIGYLKKRL
jgi:pimeloyl-ACP methyl ester carboxylesterase